MLIINCLEYFL